MGYLSAGVRQLPYSEAVVAQPPHRWCGTPDKLSWVPPSPVDNRREGLADAVGGIPIAFSTESFSLPE